MRIHLLVITAFLLAGCSAQDLATLQQTRDQTAQTLAQAQLAQSRVQQALATRPADDPLRQEATPQLAKLDAVINQMQTVLPAIDAAIKTVNGSGGAIDPGVQQAVSVIPYGSLALAALALVFGAIKHVQAGNLSDRATQAQKSFEQIVTALDAVLPNPTPDQQLKVEAALDTDVKTKLAATRSA